MLIKIIFHSHYRKVCAHGYEGHQKRMWVAFALASRNTVATAGQILIFVKLFYLAQPSSLQPVLLVSLCMKAKEADSQQSLLQTLMLSCKNSESQNCGGLRQVSYCEGRRMIFIRFWTIFVSAEEWRQAHSPESTLSLFRSLNTLQAKATARSCIRWPLLL